MASALPTSQHPLNGLAEARMGPWLEAARSGVLSRLTTASAADAGLSAPPDPRWGTALHVAAARGHSTAIDWLVEYGVALGATNSVGSSALHCAAHFGHETAVSRLLAHGAAPRAADKRGLTALHFASASLNAKAVRLLLAAGASVDAKCRDDKSSLWYARRAAATATGVARARDSSAVVALLEAADRATGRWCRAARNGDRAALEELMALASGGASPYATPLDVNVSRADGNTALHFAVRPTNDASRMDDRAQLCEWLIERGADSSRVNCVGCTALHYAVGFLGQPRIVSALLRAGAPPDLSASGLGTPLDVARRSVERCVTAEGHPAAAILDMVLASWRHRKLMRRWRLLARVIGTVIPWHARACARAYAPGGGGYEVARGSFEESARKVRRVR